MITVTICLLIFKKPQKKKQYNFTPPSEKYFKPPSENYVTPLSANYFTPVSDTPIEESFIDVTFDMFLDNHIPILKKLELGNFIIWKSPHQDQINHVYNTIIQMVENTRLNKKIRMNAIDMLMRSNNTFYIEKAQQSLQQLRREEQHLDENTLRQRIYHLNTQIHEFPYDIELQQVLLDQHRRLETQFENITKRKATIYNDSQNVHNHEINNSVIASSKNLILSDESDTNINIHQELERVCPDYYNQHREKIDETITRLENDVTKFKDGIKIHMVYEKILSIIFKSKHKDELIKRLAEELVDMNQLCSTGHLSRLINVLQGFEDIPDQFKIKINPKDEIYANISTFITTEIQTSEDPDSLLMDMVSHDKKLFFPFLIHIMKLKYQELLKQYQNVIDENKLQEYIQEAIKNYLNNEQDAITISSQLWS
jgi:hypothetical protein